MFPASNSVSSETQVYEDGFEPSRTVSKKVLIVDDDRVVLECLSLALENFGYDTLTAEDGTEAEAIVMEQAVDCILLDLYLPGKNGVELLRLFKQIAPKTPVIMITASGHIERAVECFKLGAKDFLGKPLDLEKLAATIARAMSPVSLEESYGADTRVTPNLDGFRFVRVLGEGSMGIVYLVESEDPANPAKRYALKSFKELLVIDSKTLETLRKRFTNEAMAAYTVQHPNVVKVFDFDLDKDGVPYILMEFFDAVNLKKFLQERNLTFTEKMQVLKQIALGLAKIHEHDICHRDLKLSNILINDSLHVKIMDFGIARFKDSTLTPTRHVMGSPPYMSPEAFSTARVDYRSDIFSFGSMAYEILTGERAFKGPDVASLSHNIRNQEPVWPQTLGMDMPKPLEKMLQRMLEKDPGKRCQNTQEIYEVFATYANHVKD